MTDRQTDVQKVRLRDVLCLSFSGNILDCHGSFESTVMFLNVTFFIDLI